MLVCGAVGCLVRVFSGFPESVVGLSSGSLYDLFLVVGKFGLGRIGVWALPFVEAPWLQVAVVDLLGLQVKIYLLLLVLLIWSWLHLRIDVANKLRVFFSWLRLVVACH